MRAPREQEAQERAWEIVSRSFDAREPRPRRRSAKPLVAVVTAAVVIAAAVSPPGQALLGSLGDAVTVDESTPALFSLPAPGRLLVTTRGGTWVVEEDGSRRRLGDYEDAAWSPFGRYVVATRDDELTALEPDGDVRWKLARRDVGSPAWGGTETDTRIAYVSAGKLRVVGGDGRGDQAVGPAAAVRPAWAPATTRRLAYVDAAGHVRVRGTGAPRAPRARTVPAAIAWTRRGELVVALGGRAAAISPTGRIARLSEGRVLVGNRTVFAAETQLGTIAWSADGRWLLVTWPEADQWVFVRVAGTRRIETVSGISRQLGGAARTIAWGPPEPRDP